MNDTTPTISTISNEKLLKYAGQEEYDEYLSDVIFLAGNPMRIMDEKVSNDLKKYIMTKSFSGDTNYFNEAYKKISGVLPKKDDSIQHIGKQVEINISKINDKNSDKDEWIPGTINRIDTNDLKMIYMVQTDSGEVGVENIEDIHLFKWKDCVEDCYKYCHEYVKKEVQSTAYMLRILSASVLGDTKNYKVCFHIEHDVERFKSIITGKWDDDTKKADKNLPDKNTIQDKDVFKIQICRISEDGQIIDYDKPANGRFILGAGPSASGKTYNAGLIIEMMKMVDTSFPTFFMTIDGGTYRENSVIYQSIVYAVKTKNQYPGLNNLMSASILDKVHGVQSIFETDSIKKVVNDYLLERTDRTNDKLIVSLYVPDTLTYCGMIRVDCMPKLKKYIEITGDNNWIGLMIYQHKTGGDGCPFQKTYKCVGCTESGKKREKTEGKKYSSSAWNMSYEHGLQTIKKAPNYRIVFHNGGQRETPSVFEDLSEPRIPYGTNEDIKQFFNKKNIIYINGELTKNPDCDNYLLKGCKIHNTEQNNVKKNDKEIKNFKTKYQDKYVGIPIDLITILEKHKSEDFSDFENIDENDIVSLLIIQKFINSGFFDLSDINSEKTDENEKKFQYYKIDVNKIDVNKIDDTPASIIYINNFDTLLDTHKIKIYETDAEKQTSKSSGWNRFNPFKNTEKNHVDETPGETPGETKEDDIEIKIEENPVVINTLTPDEIINTLSNNRYIGIPKEIMFQDNNDQEIKIKTLQHLIDEKIITKININEDLLDEKSVYGINERMYDYYKINIAEYIDSQIKESIRNIKAEISGSFNIITDKNTLYIYENEPEPESKEQLSDAANNKSARGLYKDVVNTGKQTWNTLLTTITGSKPKDEQTKEENPEDGNDKSNDKPPKCKKNKTVKKNATGNKANSKKKK
uniref:Uncharacterized protein n=1 Tax=viral metagenome TaxID=1070528 RepID=A0A6C0DFH8_9ZZZZ